jgi:hypothetical protein
LRATTLYLTETPDHSPRLLEGINESYRIPEGCFAKNATCNFEYRLEMDLFDTMTFPFTLFWDQKTPFLDENLIVVDFDASGWFLIEVLTVLFLVFATTFGLWWAVKDWMWRLFELDIAKKGE